MVDTVKSFDCSAALSYVLPLCLLLSISGCRWGEAVSVSSAEGAGNAASDSAAISADGRYVAFVSTANNLVANDVNANSDVFVRDTLNGTTTRVSVDSNGIGGNWVSSGPSISGDGRYVAFYSNSTNLLAEYNSNVINIFVRDRTLQTTTRVSESISGPWGGDGSSWTPTISLDGRYVTFFSAATNLVAGDTNDKPDQFLYDRVNETITRVNVDNAGNQANNSAGIDSSISDDGRFIAFDSAATNLVIDDTNAKGDIFVRDTLNSTTTRVSVDSAGNEGNGSTSYHAMSGDGRYVAFQSIASNLVPADTNSNWDIFLHDRTLQTTTRVSVDSSGTQANNYSFFPSISGDGRYITFFSAASNLVPDDANNAMDVFVHDRVTGVTTRVSLDAQGAEGDGASQYAVMSADARYVAFESRASNLTPNDLNGVADIVIRAFPHVTVTSVTPDDLPKGATTSVTISGTNFLPGATPLLESTQLSNIVVVNETTITMNVAVDANAPIGAKTLLVGLPGTGAGQFTGSLADCVDCVTFVAPPGC